MREAYLQFSRSEKFLIFLLKSKANASFNQYLIARRCAQGLPYLTSWASDGNNGLLRDSSYLVEIFRGKADFV